jgi:hypothetical protein
MAKAKELAVIDEKANALALATPDYGEYSGAGFEDMGRDDFATPFLAVLQPTSKILLEKDELRAGMLLNTVSGEAFPAEKSKGKPGIKFIPCHREHVFVEWKKRDEGGGGGGFVAVHQPGSELVQRCVTTQKFGELEVNGNDLIETFYVWGIQVLDDGRLDHMVVPFTSTKIKFYKHWMTRLKMLGGKPPIFAHIWRLQTVLETRDAGSSYNYVIEFADETGAAGSRVPVGSELFQEAVDFHRLCKEGVAKANYEAPAAADAGAQVVDSDIPF